MKLFNKINMAFLLTLFVVSPCWSHFGMLIPSDSMVMQDDNRTITVTLSFSHPFELVGMEMAKPGIFSVLAGENQWDLLKSLEDIQVMGHQAWRASFPLKRPGAYVF